MMTHPDRLFELAKQKMEQNQREINLANAQTCVMRHWLAEQVRHVADRLEPKNIGEGQEQLLGIKH
jgi:hypothetical protein